MSALVAWKHRLRMTQESKWSELNEVCANGDTDLLEEMLISGKHEHIDYKDPDWGDRSPLHWCCIVGKSDMTMSLLEKGAHPGIRTSCGWTPAHYAAESGKTHVLRMLHQYHAPMDRKDPFGDTPRRIAEVYGHKEAVDFLSGAEREYRVWRRKAELSSEVDPYDDEDVDWCSRNNVKPEKFITDDELAEIQSTVTSLSLTDSVSSLTKGKSKGYHYPKNTKSAQKKRSSINSERSSNRSSAKKKSVKKQNVKTKRKSSIAVKA